MKKINWTKAWSNKYPVLKQYQQKVNIPYYSKKIREMFISLQNEYGYNELVSNPKNLDTLVFLLLYEYNKVHRQQKKPWFTRLFLNYPCARGCCVPVAHG